MQEVNDWLSDERRLNTGYRLERVEFKENSGTERIP